MRPANLRATAGWPSPWPAGDTPRLTDEVATSFALAAVRGLDLSGEAAWLSAAELGVLARRCERLEWLRLSDGAAVASE